MNISRRKFLKDASGALALGFGGSAALPLTAATEQTSRLIASPPEEQRHGEMIFRRLGRTGEWVSLIGLGGYHIGKQADENESIRLIRLAIDKGISFMDNCWDYNGGESEVRMGKALRDGYREKVFLMTKVDGRTKQTAGQQIDDSLRRLHTDHIDLCNIMKSSGWTIRTESSPTEALRKRFSRPGKLARSAISDSLGTKIR